MRGPAVLRPDAPACGPTGLLTPRSWPNARADRGELADPRLRLDLRLDVPPGSAA
ncbi:hypothetical protein GCM10010199_60280 [Dactylosporangium roseum]